MQSIRNVIRSPYMAGRSMGVRLLLYWSAMALLLVATILSILMATGVLSHPARQLAGALDIQQRNTYAALDAQMDDLTARGAALSEKLGRELDAFLAAKGIPFNALNDDPSAIAELEKRLYAPLSSTLSAASCSGIFFCLNVTANTALPDANAQRAGLYLRYTGLQPTVASEQDVICFRGAAEASRELQLQMHNRWNPELNTALIPGSEKLFNSQAARPAEGSLWTKRSELLDTWEHVMLLCVPVMDSSGAVRGFCGMEISDLYFTLSHDTVFFLLAMRAAANILSRRFVKPINESLAAVRGGTTEAVASGIPEIDELLAMIRERPVGALPPDVEARLCGFAERAGTLTGMERTILQYYMDGYTVRDVPELAHISTSTVKTHNRNLYRKLGVDSFDELKVYLELFAACSRSGELLNRQ